MTVVSKEVPPMLGSTGDEEEDEDDDVNDKDNDGA
jgi:hypothetical protein